MNKISILYHLIIFNNTLNFKILFFPQLFGGVIIGIGIWAYLEKQKYYSKEIESVYDVIFDMAIVFFVLGVIIFILGYAGCIGALRENIFLLKFVSICFFIYY